MPRQSRVTAFGEIVATLERGTFMGNRGVLHDAEGQLKRPWQLKRWIVCVLEFRGRKRQVMTPGRYTELFFLDEATALAAGHRRCAECRHARFLAFCNAWKTAQPVTAIGEAHRRRDRQPTARRTDCLRPHETVFHGESGRVTGRRVCDCCGVGRTGLPGEGRPPATLVAPRLWRATTATEGCRSRTRRQGRHSRFARLRDTAATLCVCRAVVRSRARNADRPHRRVRPR